MFVSLKAKKERESRERAKAFLASEGHVSQVKAVIREIEATDMCVRHISGALRHPESS